VSKSLCDILIEPPGLANLSAFDVSKARTYFDTGYDFVKQNFTSDKFLKFSDK